MIVSNLKNSIFNILGKKIIASVNTKAILKKNKDEKCTQNEKKMNYESKSKPWKNR